jgi:hypothetical protein
MMVALPIGMLTFDANSFTQVPFVFWIVLGCRQSSSG